MKKTMPFKSLLEYTHFFLQLKNNIHGLKEFTSKRHININGVEFDYFDYFNMLMFEYTYDTGVSCANPWLLFQNSSLDTLLEDDFFSEYRRTLEINKAFTTRKYPFLEVYIYYKLHSMASDYLSYDETNLMAGNWLWNDEIEQIYNFGWYEIIANVYKNFGVHWFCDRKTDPILYKFAYYAIMSCKKSCIISPKIIKQDLIQLYSELLISFSIRNSLNENKDILELVKNAVINFDDEQLNKLALAISSLERDKFELIDSNKQLTNGIVVLREQIAKLQQNTIDGDTMERIVYQIYCLSPQNPDYESQYDFFKSIWDKLSDSTKKDIKQSMTMFQKFDSIDLAIFPLLRSLEHEFIVNFIQPFHQSPQYLDLLECICIKEKYQMTHDCLIKRNTGYPTIGNIPFIGRCLEKDDALKSSNVLNALSLFLNSRKASFCTICKNIDSFSIGSQKLKLVNIRNGIVHGNMELAATIDKQCYSDITAMLYNPPVRILFEIIENSMRGEFL